MAAHLDWLSSAPRREVQRDTGDLTPRPAGGLGLGLNARPGEGDVGLSPRPGSPVGTPPPPPGIERVRMAKDPIVSSSATAAAMAEENSESCDACNCEGAGSAPLLLCVGEQPYRGDSLPMASSNVNGPLASLAAPASALGRQLAGVLKERAGDSTTSGPVACAGPGRVLGDTCLPLRLLGDSGRPAEPCLAKVKDVMRVPPSPSAPDPPFANDI